MIIFMYLNVYSICTTWATLLLVNVYSNSVRNILYTQFRKILLLSHTFCIPFRSCHRTWEIYQYRVSLSTTTSSPSWFTGTCKASRYHSNPRGLSTTLTCSCYWTQSARKHSLILDLLSQEMTLMVFLDLSQKVWIFLNCTKHVHTYVLAWYYILCIIVIMFRMLKTAARDLIRWVPLHTTSQCVASVEAYLAGVQNMEHLSQLNAALLKGH